MSGQPRMTKCDEAPVEGLADLPIEVAEAMYSPDFVELATLSANGTPLVLPMSFTLDVAGNAVRFSSPVAAARIANLARDRRCCVSFSRVTSGHPAVLMQGVATLGDLVEGVRRGPARRFTVAPSRLVALDQPARPWRFRSDAPPAIEAPTGVARPEPRTGSALQVAEAELEAVTRFETAVLALRDRDGWPISMPVEVRREDASLIVSLPDSGLLLRDGPASLLGHTWMKDGPRYLALTGRCEVRVPGSGGVSDNPYSEVTFLPRRAMRRP